MGNFCQKLTSPFRKRTLKILMVGLDAVGKTSTLYRLKCGEIVTTIPTIGCNEEMIVYSGTNFTIMDLSGREGYRHLWKHHYSSIDAVIYVLDSSDTERMTQCRDEVWKFFEEEDLKEKVILVLANKQDLPCALTVEEVAERLEIGKAKGRKIYVQGTCATNGDGLYEGLSWILESHAEQKHQRRSLMNSDREVLIADEQRYSYQFWSSIVKCCRKTS